MCRARIGGLVAAIWVAALPALAQPQSDARQRQAAAEAYDQGTAAYLSQDYEKAGQWFETANRMSPAAPALIQAARAHQQAGHLDHAATLALRLTLEHADDPNAVQFGQNLLNQLAGKFVRIDVGCDGCTLDVDGSLQESQSFFVEPDATHTVTASFETGERKAEVTGQAGQTQTLEFEAPPPPPPPTDTSIDRPETANGGRDQSPKPLKPVFTFVGAGITAALLVGSIISTVDMNHGVSPYEAAAKKWQDCTTAMHATAPCEDLRTAARAKYDDGHKKETRTTVLWVATGAVAATTGVIALFLTDWSGRKKEHAQEVRLAAVPTVGGAALFMKGSF